MDDRRIPRWSRPGVSGTRFSSVVDEGSMTRNGKGASPCPILILTIVETSLNDGKRVVGQNRVDGKVRLQDELGPNWRIQKTGRPTIDVRTTL